MPYRIILILYSSVNHSLKDMPPTNTTQKEATPTPPPALTDPTPSEAGPSSAPQAPPTAEAPAPPKENVPPAKQEKPTDTVPVLRKDKKSNQIPQKIKFTVSNLNSIAQNARSSTDFDAGLTPIESKPIGTYFDSLDIKRKLITDKETFFTIDVQPDMRFFTYYSAFTTAQAHPKLVTDNHPHVSIPSIIGYKLVILTAELLIIDLYARRFKSSYSTPFLENSTLKSALSLLMSCRVPSDTLIPLEQLAPLKDPLRPDL